MTDRVPVTPPQIAAARLRVVCDKKLRRETPGWIVKLAQTRLSRMTARPVRCHPTPPARPR